MANVFNINSKNNPSALLSSGVIFAVIALLIIFNSVFTVDAGERAVILRFGAIHTIKTEGLNFKIPIVDEVVKIEVRIRKSMTKTESSSKDLQEVSSEIALNYHLDPTRVSDIYKEIGLSWNERIIDPAIRETMKATAARYTAEQLITKRSEVSNLIKEFLRTSISKYGLIVDEVSITDFSFSEEFDRAIESKQTAEQMALKASRDLDRIKIEAEQQITAAKAEAESLRLQKQVVSKELIQLREMEVRKIAVEKWNGILPRVTGGAVPFIDVK